MKLLQYFVLAVISAALAMAQTDTTTTQSATRKTTVTHKRSQAVTQADLQELKDVVALQQQQIHELQQQVQQRDQAIQQVQQQLNQTQSAASDAQTKAQSAAESARAVPALQSDVADLKTNNTNAALALQETQKQFSESPTAIRFKGITLTPGGFIAAETVYRGRALAADINTPFNSLSAAGATQSKLSEFFATGRQSRLALLAEGKLSSAKLTGYYEADFLSAGVTSNNNESNSYTFRQRQLWTQAALKNGWTFTGGQMWSLVTETLKGVDNRSEALPMTIDPQYHVGFSWARQYGFRVSKDFGDKVWLAFSLENPQATLTVHGNTSNFVIGSLGNSGGLYNAFNGNYSFNPSPDFIAKAVFEPGWGHYELFGVVSHFRDRIFPNAGLKTPSAVGAFNNSDTGTGIGANARGLLFNKHVGIGFHFLSGNGVGRYGTSGLPDLTVRPDGVLSLVRSYQGLGTLEFHAPKFDIYLNGGAEYAQRTAFLNSAGKPVGYGSPLFSNAGCANETLPAGGNGFTPGGLSNCTTDTRNVFEGTVGFWYRLYNGPKGKLQFGPQYSYVVRNTWGGVAATGTNGISPKGVENMVLTSFRYYLP
jgi:hypothetical protein